MRLFRPFHLAKWQYFQGWSMWVTSFQGFHPWLFYLRAFGALRGRTFSWML